MQTSAGEAKLVKQHRTRNVRQGVEGVLMEAGSIRGAGPARQLRLRYPVVVLVAFLLPGVASLMLRGWREVGLRSLLLLAAIPVAFLIFGPLWGGVIFATSPKEIRNLGF